MRLGILSDSHNDAGRMREAITALRDRGAGYVIHCGDIMSPDMLELFHIVPGRFAAGFVYGNNDIGKCDSLRRRAKELGVDCFEFFKEFTMAGKSFAVLHGDDAGEPAGPGPDDDGGLRLNFGERARGIIPQREFAEKDLTATK